jgi:glycerate-2-kinase
MSAAASCWKAALGDSAITVPTLTNVNDFRAILSEC